MRPHTAARRRRFAPRGHELRDRGQAGEVQRISYRVPGADSTEAIAAAHVEAVGEGWKIRTVATCRQATDAGLWVVTFAAVPG